MKQNAIYAVTLWLMAFCGSCVYEDLGDCFFGLRLNFVSTLYDAEGEQNHKPIVSSVKVFVFDTDSLLCAVISREGECLAPNYTLDVALPPGSYKVMVWGSNHTDFSRSYSVGAESHPITIGQTRISDLLLELKCDADKEISDIWVPCIANFDDLYYATVGKRASATSIYTIEDVVIPKYSIVQKEVDFMRNTNLLNISIIGAQNLKIAKENLELCAHGYNRGYLYNNNRNEKIGEVKYTAQNLTSTNQTWQYEIKTQRIEEDSYANKPLMLYLLNKENNHVIYKLNIIKTLLEAKDNNENYLYKNQEAIDRKYVHSIELKVEGEGANADIRIFVNGWEIKNIYPAGR